MPRTALQYAPCCRSCTDRYPYTSATTGRTSPNPTRSLICDQRGCGLLREHHRKMPLRFRVQIWRQPGQTHGLHGHAQSHHHRDAQKGPAPKSATCSAASSLTVRKLQRSGTPSPTSQKLASRQFRPLNVSWAHRKRPSFLRGQASAQKLLNRKNLSPYSPWSGGQLRKCAYFSLFKKVMSRSRKHSLKSSLYYADQEICCFHVEIFDLRHLRGGGFV